LRRAKKLDKFDFLSVNCNLQRLDGPVRRNGQIIQELESAFRARDGMSFKVLWGSEWDPILERDTEGCSSSAWANWWTASIRSWWFRPVPMFREHFFGHDPRLLKLVETAAG